MSDDETFETVDAGSSHTFPIAAGDLKKGDHVCIKGFPCRVVEVTTSKTGKHGHAKANITAIDIFTGRKYEEVAPTSHSLPAPFVNKVELQLIDIGADGALSLLDEDNNERNDMNLPPDEELADRIKRDFEAAKDIAVIVQSAMGTQQVVGYKVAGQNQ